MTRTCLDCPETVFGKRKLCLTCAYQRRLARVKARRQNARRRRVRGDLSTRAIEVLLNRRRRAA